MTENTDTREPEGNAYQRIRKAYIARCPVHIELLGEGSEVRALVTCTWKSRRHDHESDAWTEIAGHLRRDHGDLDLVTLRTFRQTVMWEPVADGTTAEED